MKFFKFIAGNTIAMTMLLAGILMEGGHFSSLVQLTALVMVCGASLATIFATFGFNTVLKATAFAFNGKAKDVERNAATNLFQIAGTYFLTFGILGSLLGCLHTFRNLDRPEQIGPGVAVAVISLIYGFGLKLFVSDPLSALVQESESTESNIKSIKRKSKSKAA